MPDKELLCRSKLAIYGRDLDPNIVTASLGVFPDQAFKRGEASFARDASGKIDGSRPSGYTHSKGSWQKNAEQSLLKRFVSDHLDYWCRFLESHEKDFRQFLTNGFTIHISFYIDWA